MTQAETNAPKVKKSVALSGTAAGPAKRQLFSSDISFHFLLLRLKYNNLLPFCLTDGILKCLYNSMRRIRGSIYCINAFSHLFSHDLTINPIPCICKIIFIILCGIRCRYDLPSCNSHCYCYTARAIIPFSTSSIGSVYVFSAWSLCWCNCRCRGRSCRFRRRTRRRRVRGYRNRPAAR